MQKKQKPDSLPTKSKTFFQQHSKQRRKGVTKNEKPVFQLPDAAKPNFTQISYPVHIRVHGNALKK